MGFFSDSKDRMIETVALPMLNNVWLKPFGHATSLKLDTSNKSAEIQLELKGEHTPLTIHVQDYEVVREGDGTFIVVKAVNTSREWMTAMAREYVVGRKLAVPSEAAGMMSRFL
jgi:hypothetical protein